ncbi:hypothetical protein L596_005579 [Steinernema carpocapsae]|uniref:Uncharacterized protein n=1 Tax=Steinernema carpocapsae TaxID=34508 RepID=A0A4U8V3F9_STECR|nr:hypothetical protein L596_005579 [Steinernema carpocapsae]
MENTTKANEKNVAGAAKKAAAEAAGRIAAEAAEKNATEAAKKVAAEAAGRTAAEAAEKNATEAAKKVAAEAAGRTAALEQMRKSEEATEKFRPAPVLTPLTSMGAGSSCCDKASCKRSSEKCPSREDNGVSATSARGR